MISTTRQKMSNLRQRSSADFPDGSCWVRTYPLRLTFPHISPRRSHEWLQLSYAVKGSIRITTDAAAFVAQPRQCVWIPAGVEHVEASKAGTAIRSLFFAPGICRDLSLECAIFSVPPLLRELIVATTGYGVLDARAPEQMRLAQVIVDRLKQLVSEPAQRLPMPKDVRALRAVKEVEQNLGEAPDIAALARRTGTAKRTLERVFAEETGLSFGRWLRRARLLAAVERLGAGATVTDAAFHVGYSSLSAFVSAFRREFDRTPKQFSKAAK